VSCFSYFFRSLLEDFRKGVNDIKTPVGRRLFVLAEANKLVHLRIGEYGTLIAASDVAGHPGVGVLLERCLSDKLAFVGRIRRQINRQLQEELVTP
jgi:hypothetical protein